MAVITTVVCLLSLVASSNAAFLQAKATLLVDPATKPVAVVYNGAAACLDCTKAAVDALSSDYDVKVMQAKWDADLMKSAAVYVQPGGADNMMEAWLAVKDFKDPLTAWLKNGGHYVGICMGGYLAGKDSGGPGIGFEILGSYDSNDFSASLKGKVGTSVPLIGEKTFTKGSMADYLMPVIWEGKSVNLFFQGGPSFFYTGYGGPRDGVEVATYPHDKEELAALIVPYGSGSVGVLGPHPEAPLEWYAKLDSSLTIPPTQYFRDFVAKTIAMPRKQQ